jgi:hypothetical protein
VAASDGVPLEEMPYPAIMPGFVEALLTTRLVNRVLHSSYKIEDLYGPDGWRPEEFVMFDITAKVLSDKGLL